MPILGINMGTLGYLTEVEVGNIEEAIGQIVSNDYTFEDRMMLEAVSYTHLDRDGIPGTESEVWLQYQRDYYEGAGEG